MSTTPRTLKELRRLESRYFVDGPPQEDDFGLNDLQREKIAAFAAERGDCWLGVVNIYEEEKPILTKYQGQFIYNSAFAYAIPHYDDELVRLVQERHDAPYTGVADDAQRIHAIHQRIESLGGMLLVWV